MKLGKFKKGFEEIELTGLKSPILTSDGCFSACNWSDLGFAGYPWQNWVKASISQRNSLKLRHGKCQISGAEVELTCTRSKMAIRILNSEFIVRILIGFFKFWVIFRTMTWQPRGG